MFERGGIQKGWGVWGSQKIESFIFECLEWPTLAEITANPPSPWTPPPPWRKPWNCKIKYFASCVVVIDMLSAVVYEIQIGNNLVFWNAFNFHVPPTTPLWHRW